VQAQEAVDSTLTSVISQEDQLRAAVYEVWESWTKFRGVDVRNSQIAENAPTPDTSDRVFAVSERLATDTDMLRQLASDINARI
jgi:hypothetical protein